MRGYRAEVHLSIDGEAQTFVASFLLGQALCVVIEPLREGARVEVGVVLAPGQADRPVRLRGLAGRLQRLGHSFVLKRKRPPTASEVAEALGLGLREARDLIERTRSPVCEESAAHGALPRLVLGEPRRKRALTPEEERILRARFGIATPEQEPIEEPGQDFGITRERIRPISARALRRLRHPSRLKAIEKFMKLLHRAHHEPDLILSWRPRRRPCDMIRSLP
ncbi:MAG: hypothetical protein MUF64_28610 [Polyangiaceae bacterium]|nr:hypothetical protein [Polyangiaceae bacterium]